MANEENATLNYAPNYANVVEINITPNTGKKTWANALDGIEECTPDADETSTEMDTYDLLGGTEELIDKVRPHLSMTGKRKYGSKAQDFIQSRALLTGEDRKTDYRWTQPDGTVLEGVCTLAELKPGSMGKSSEKGSFSYKMKLNTWDANIDNTKSNLMPTDVTAKAVTVQVGKDASIEATVAPTGTNQRCHYFVGDESIAEVNSDGVVKGIAEGETLVTIKCAAKPSIVTQVKVTVTGAAPASTK